MENPFDYVKAINKKTSIDDIDGYQPYLTNHSLMPFGDTVLLANEMNRFPDLPKQMQFDFYYHAVRKGNRFEPWLKKNKNETYDNIELLQRYYGYSRNKALQALDILREDQLEWIRKQFDVGGV
jgi:hypothetical protein